MSRNSYLSASSVFSGLMLISLIFFQCSNPNGLVQHVDLSQRLDTNKLCINPHKGWYHHLFDNGLEIYKIRNDSVFASFPGMDHLYIRIAWSFLEPGEGKYDWHLIDEVVNKYVPLGYGISFRITSKETGTYPGVVGKEVAGVQYATPYWVVKAGAAGTVAEKWGIRSWVPDWDDPIYLSKLDAFHRAFAARYDGKPWLRYVDVGSIGEWGEGHTHFSTQVPPSPEEVKANIEVYLKNYTKTQLIITDDLLTYRKSDKEIADLLGYVLKTRISFRDDSPMVDWYMHSNMDTWTITNPWFYDSVYLKNPVVFELEHYGAVKENKNWMGPNGADSLPEFHTTGASIFRHALELMHASYVGYHGYCEDWLQENPELTREITNRMGYWFALSSADLPAHITAGDSLHFRLDWINRGVAPAYHPYELFVCLQNDSAIYTSSISSSGNRHWLPGVECTESYAFLPGREIRPGKYAFGIQLRDLADTGREIQLALSDSLLNTQGYYILANLTVN